MIRVIFVLGVGACVPAAYAGGPGHEPNKQEKFAKMKQIKLEGMQGRLSVMQAALACVQSAQTPDRMQACEQRERSAMDTHQQRMKQRWESLR
jgi:hypothetical protein